MEWRDLRKAAKDQGWTEEIGGKGQWKLKPPDRSKPMVVIHQTPSDHRAIRNALNLLKKSGLQWPWPPPKGQKKKGDKR